ncbi:TPA: IS66 family transposase zinc-finger binding domain-containing protein [Vibrio parahaemolyticus]|uniref:IS66 family transposase zinc-finger binding domain-containing protein n=1 Tax=Vibrio parahaemolyticus TaxID=670 RepID=UPI00084A4E1A|nr:IS66 family transposase zinc-finger binding domain-containing protein [Vibrio parahaemolyticus]MDG2993736.1 IS66 family transposase zinc-finger binding domain-containing protein [Vibrio parahaemolyticus]ODW09103.1 hypothetical protein BBL79_21215 [Vibrio parahaemolyticus]ODW09877.1 hypothetical protein BBM87_16695 [Vibrio parahaemolyticus]
MKNDISQHDGALLRALLDDKDKRLNALEQELCHLRLSLGDSESTVHTLRQTVHTLRQSLNESELTIQSLVEQLNLARRKRYGSSSETMPPQDLEFNEAETHADDSSENDDNQKSSTSETQESKRRGRPKLPEGLPREHVVVDVPEEDKTCTCCQSTLSQMGAESSEKLVYIPARLYVEVIERPKYVCRECDAQGNKVSVVMASSTAIHHT